MTITWNQCNELCLPAGRTPVLRGKTLTKSVQPHFFFIPAIVVGIINFYHFVPPLLTLTLLGDHKVSAKQNPLASFSRTFFI